MPNRFSLVVVAANRTRQLMGNCTPLVATKNKHAVTALREIAEQKVVVSGNGSENKVAASETIEALLPPQSVS